MRVQYWSRIVRVTAAVALAAGVLAPLTSQAAEAPAPTKAGFAVSPPTFELSANPGDTVRSTVRIDNLTDTPLKLLVDRRNFAPQGEEGQADLTEEETNFSLAQWIRVQGSLDLPARTTRDVPFSIVVPAAAEPGGHFGSIVFKTEGTQVDETGATLTAEVGALLLMRVAGPITEKATIDSFKTTKVLFETPPVQFETRVKNEGNVHLKPTGSILIKNMFGKTVANVQVEGRNVLPDSIRRLDTEWKPNFALGKYTATVSTIVGEKNTILTASTDFYVFPWKIAAIVLIALLLLITLFIKKRKRIRKAFKVLFGK